MKHLLFLVALLPFFVCAQNDPKYLEGSVPVVDGKVVFQKNIQLASNSGAEAFQLAKAWAAQRFDKEECRVVYENPDKGELVAAGKEYIVFTSNALSLDRSKMSYSVLIHCSNSSCSIQLTNIRYEYNVTYQREPEKYTAEEWITDKHALFKGKLNRISGKFRCKTIDFAEDLFADAEKSMGGKAVVSEPVSLPLTNEEKPVVDAPGSVRSVADKPAHVSLAPEGFTLLESGKVSSTLQSMMKESDLCIQKSGNNMGDSDVIWKGLGTMFGKNVAYISLDKNSAFLKEDKTGETFTLQFSTKPFSQDSVWMIIECTRQGETPDDNRQTVVAEVLKIWIK